MLQLHKFIKYSPYIRVIGGVLFSLYLSQNLAECVGTSKIYNIDAASGVKDISNTDCMGNLNINLGLQTFEAVDIKTKGDLRKAVGTINQLISLQREKSHAFTPGHYKVLAQTFDNMHYFLYTDSKPNVNLVNDDVVKFKHWFNGQYNAFDRINRTYKFAANWESVLSHAISDHQPFGVSKESRAHADVLNNELKQFKELSSSNYQYFSIAKQGNHLNVQLAYLNELWRNASFDPSKRSEATKMIDIIKQCLEKAHPLKDRNFSHSGYEPGSFKLSLQSYILVDNFIATVEEDLTKMTYTVAKNISSENFIDFQRVLSQHSSIDIKDIKYDSLTNVISNDAELMKRIQIFNYLTSTSDKTRDTKSLLKEAELHRDILGCIEQYYYLNVSRISLEQRVIFSNWYQNKADLIERQSSIFILANPTRLVEPRYAETLRYLVSTHKQLESANVKPQDLIAQPKPSAPPVFGPHMYPTVPFHAAEVKPVVRASFKFNEMVPFNPEFYEVDSNSNDTASAKKIAPHYHNAAVSNFVERIKSNNSAADTKNLNNVASANNATSANTVSNSANTVSDSANTVSNSNNPVSNSANTVSNSNNPVSNSANTVSNSNNPAATNPVSNSANTVSNAADTVSNSNNPAATNPVKSKQQVNFAPVISTPDSDSDNDSGTEFDEAPIATYIPKSIAKESYIPLQKKVDSKPVHPLFAVQEMDTLAKKLAEAENQSVIAKKLEVADNIYVKIPKVTSMSKEDIYRQLSQDFDKYFNTNDRKDNKYFLPVDRTPFGPSATKGSITHQIEVAGKELTDIREKAYTYCTNMLVARQNVILAVDASNNDGLTTEQAAHIQDERHTRESALEQVQKTYSDTLALYFNHREFCSFQEKAAASKTMSELLLDPQTDTKDLIKSFPSTNTLEINYKDLPPVLNADYKAFYPNRQTTAGYPKITSFKRFVELENNSIETQLATLQKRISDGESDALQYLNEVLIKRHDLEVAQNYKKINIDNYVTTRDSQFQTYVEKQILSRKKELEEANAIYQVQLHKLMGYKDLYAFQQGLLGNHTTVIENVTPSNETSDVVIITPGVKFGQPAGVPVGKSNITPSYMRRIVNFMLNKNSLQENVTSIQNTVTAVESKSMTKEKQYEQLYNTLDNLQRKYSRSADNSNMTGDDSTHPFHERVRETQKQLSQLESNQKELEHADLVLTELSQAADEAQKTYSSSQEVLKQTSTELKQVAVNVENKWNKYISDRATLANLLTLLSGAGTLLGMLVTLQKNGVPVAEWSIALLKKLPFVLQWLRGEKVAETVASNISSSTINHVMKTGVSYKDVGLISIGAIFVGLKQLLKKLVK